MCACTNDVLSAWRPAVTGDRATATAQVLQVLHVTPEAQGRGTACMSQTRRVPRVQGAPTHKRTPEVLAQTLRGEIIFRVNFFIPLFMCV